MPPPGFVAFDAALGALALMEVALSRRNQRKVQVEDQAAAGGFRLMVGLHVALFVLPLVEIAAFGRRPRHPWPWIAATGAATALRWWSIRSLGSSWNVRGAVPAELEVVSSGPYRWVRHPNYVAVALEMLALPLAGGAWMSAILLSAVNAAILSRRIAEEERRLFEQPRYRDRFASRKRFIPGVF